MENLKVLLAAAEKQNLSSMYQNEIDKNLYEENTDFDKDATGLFWDIDTEKFILVGYVTPNSGWKSAFESQNAVKFIAWVDANVALTKTIEELLYDLEDQTNS